MPGSAAPGSTRQRVLVTGGASGIGRAMAEAFIATGARVHVADLVGEPPVGAGFTTTDVADETAVDGLFKAVASDLGGLDVLCNNVGIAGPTGPIEDLDVDADGRFEIILRILVRIFNYHFECKIQI